MGLKILRSAVGSMPSWGIIEEFQKKGVEIIGMDSNPLSFGLHKLKKGYLVPKGEDPTFIDKLLKIIDVEKPNTILSGPEDELVAISKNKELIESKGVKVICPNYESVKIAIDKKKTYDFFKKKKIPYPLMFEQKKAKFPCILKPSRGSGSTNVFKVQNKEELSVFIKKIKNPIIQEFVDGEEYTIDILADEKSNVLSIVPRVRIGTESGISVKGKTIEDKEIVSYCIKIVKELKIVGPCCIQCIRGKDKTLKFLEINLRFGGGSILSIRADDSFVENFLRIVRGESPLKSRGYEKNLYMLRHYSETFVKGEDLNEGSNL